jgi:enoyl-CoA hydratase
MDYQYLSLEVEDGLGILTMNRPPANAIGTDLIDEFKSMTAEIKEDEEVRCVIIRSALPKYFMVGADLRVMPQEVDLSGIDYTQAPEKILADTFEKMRPHFISILKRGQEMMNAVEAIPKPTIAAISGHALGGGLELAMACDLRIMARGKPKVGLTETALSLIPSAGGTQRLPRLVGRAKALEMILLAKKLDADDADAIGLVTEAVDQDRLDARAIEIGKSLAKGATIALGCAKQCVIESWEVSLSEGLALETESVEKLIDSHDMLEGLIAFSTGKEPTYSGH